MTILPFIDFNLEIKASLLFGDTCTLIVLLLPLYLISRRTNDNAGAKKAIERTILIDSICSTRKVKLFTKRPVSILSIPSSVITYWVWISISISYITRMAIITANIVSCIQKKKKRSNDDTNIRIQYHHPTTVLKVLSICLNFYIDIFFCEDKNLFNNKRPNKNFFICF